MNAWPIRCSRSFSREARSPVTTNNSRDDEEAWLFCSSCSRKQQGELREQAHLGLLWDLCRVSLSRKVAHFTRPPRAGVPPLTSGQPCRDLGEKANLYLSNGDGGAGRDADGDQVR